MHSLRTSFLALVLIGSGATAQTFSLASSGYRLPSNSIAVAPGQVTMVSVRGLALSLPEPVIPVTGFNVLPTELNGVAVDFVQGSTNIKLGIRMLEQTSCAGVAGCRPATSILLQIPYELDTASGARAVLRIKEAGVPAGEIALNPVTDAIHILNTCDETRVFISAAADAGIPPGVCVSGVLNYSSMPPLVTPATPAKEGHVLAINAYGLGAIEGTDGPGIRFAAQPFTLNFYFAGAEKMPERRIFGVQPDAVAAGGGLYQVNFKMPAVPEGLPACEGPAGYNLTVVVSGMRSADAARICVSR